VIAINRDLGEYLLFVRRGIHNGLRQLAVITRSNSPDALSTDSCSRTVSLFLWAPGSDKCPTQSVAWRQNRQTMAKPLTVEFGPITPDNIEQVRASAISTTLEPPVTRTYRLILRVVSLRPVEDDSCCLISCHVPRRILSRSREDKRFPLEQVCLLSGCACRRNLL
jgi:hypothetical protein